MMEYEPQQPHYWDRYPGEQARRLKHADKYFYTVLFLNDQNIYPPVPPNEEPTDPKHLAIIFRRNSLESLFDLIASFDQTYFYSMEEDVEIKYLVKKEKKDLYFLTKYTDELDQVEALIDKEKYVIEYSWIDHKKYKDEFNGYDEKYGYI